MKTASVLFALNGFMSGTDAIALLAGQHGKHAKISLHGHMKGKDFNYFNQYFKDVLPVWKTEPGSECPDYLTMTNEEQCKDAARHLGINYKSTSKNLLRPRGCFWDKNGHIYFNLQPIGAVAPMVGGVCHQVAPGTFQDDAPPGIEDLYKRKAEDDAPDLNTFTDTMSLDKNIEQDQDYSRLETESDEEKKGHQGDEDLKKKDHKDDDEDNAEEEDDDNWHPRSEHKWRPRSEQEVDLLDDDAIEVSKNYYTPVMMFTHGCSASTAGIHTLKELMQAHGQQSEFMKNAELIKALDETTTTEKFQQDFASVEGRPDVGEQVCKSKSLTDKVRIVNNFAKQRGIVLTFKNELDYAKNVPELMHYLRNEAGARVFLYTRFNTIDVLKCRVTDFCADIGNQDIGYPVDADGTKAKCSFRGRDEDDAVDNAPDRVYLDPNVFLKSLRYQKMKDEEHKKYLQGKLGSEDIGSWTFQEFSAEELLAYEYGPAYDPKGVDKSTEQWTKLLKSIGITNVDKGKVREILGNLDQYPAPKSHKESIKNFDEIKSVLKGTEFEHMLREDGETAVNEWVGETVSEPVQQTVVNETAVNETKTPETAVGESAPEDMPPGTTESESDTDFTDVEDDVDPEEDGSED